MFHPARCDVAVSLIIFILFITGFREGGRAMRADLWVWAKIPSSPLCLYPVWSGATVQPWGAALMSCLCVCSRLCCCLRSALASNGCKYSQECRHLVLWACPHLYPALHSNNVKTDDVMKLHGTVWLFAACCSILWNGGPMAASERAPTFLRLLLIRGEAVRSVHVHLMKGTGD